MAGTLYKSYVGIMWCHAFHCEKGWYFAGSIIISVFFKNDIPEDAVFPDHIRSAGIADRHRQVSVSVFFVKDCNELFDAPGT